MRQYNPSSTLTAVADGWAIAMEAKFYAEPHSWKQAMVSAMKNLHVHDRVFVQGIFGSARENISVLEAVVNYHATPTTITFSHRQPQEIIEEEANLTLWGTLPGRSVVAELLRGETPRAATWRSLIAKEAIDIGNRPVDRYALEMKSALDAAISAGVDHAIGGDVAVLILERDRPARWFSRPPICNN